MLVLKIIENLSDEYLTFPLCEIVIIICSPCDQVPTCKELCHQDVVQRPLVSILMDKAQSQFAEKVHLEYPNQSWYKSRLDQIP